MKKPEPRNQNMDNFELDDACKTLAASKTNYSLAKEIILLRQELEGVQRELDEANHMISYQSLEYAMSNDTQPTK